MLISTKGRYALRVMVDLAEHEDEGFIPLKEIALRQEISEKYLESILCVLSKAGFVHAVRGKGGGYKLSKAPDQYTVGSIVVLTDRSFATVSCLGEKENICPRAPACKTLPMWTKLDRTIRDFFENITLKDLLIGME